jgi:hypothetical protein
MRYAFINADGIVVNLIAGELTDEQQAQFLRDYAILFGATQVLSVDSDTAVWIGGSYTDGTFIALSAPTEPEVPSDPLPS